MTKKKNSEVTVTTVDKVAEPDLPVAEVKKSNRKGRPKGSKNLPKDPLALMQRALPVDSVPLNAWAGKTVSGVAFVQQLSLKGQTLVEIGEINTSGDVPVVNKLIFEKSQLESVMKKLATL